MAGTFGYELDLNQLADEEKEEIRQQIIEYKTYAGLIQNGRYYRLTCPQTDEVGAGEFVSEDRSEALVQAVRLKQHGNMPVNYIRIRGLEENAVYRETSTGRCYNSEALSDAGFPVPVGMGEYQAYQWHFVRER